MHPLSSLSLALCLPWLASACANSAEAARQDALTKNVGIYAPPPTGLAKVRVGVPSFELTDKGIDAEVAKVAADQLTTLCQNAERFEVVERARLDAVLKEQGLEGIVTGTELARSARVHGVDYLLIGKVSNLRVKSQGSETGFDLGSVPVPGAAGAVLGLFGFTTHSSTIQVECGVDLRLVDPTTGVAIAAGFSEFRREDSVDAFGLKILGAKADATASENIAADNHGKILRLALDDCLKKMLPKIDASLLARQSTAVSKS